MRVVAVFEHRALARQRKVEVLGQADAEALHAARQLAAILGFDEAGKDVLNLYTAENNVLTCHPRG